MTRPGTGDLEKITVAEDATVRAAMQAIDRGAVEIALVVDRDGRLTGTVTDGDVRRAILAGAGLADPVAGHMRRRFTSVPTSATRTEVLDLMQARFLSQIPILDTAGRLVGLHLLREILGAVSRPNWAVVMAGGRGERLRPVTDALPKPMVSVAGRPILERIVLHLVGHGLRRIFLAVNYKAPVIERHFDDGSAFGCRIEYLREDVPLGTGGALSLLPAAPTDPILVMNGDLLTQVDIGRMLAFHVNGGFRATVGVHEYLHTVPYGVVDQRGARLTGIREKPTHSWLANTGIYVFEPALLARVPTGAPFPLPTLVEKALDGGEAVGAFRIEEDWADVGHPQALRLARGQGDPT